MKEFIIENGIVVDDIDSIMNGLADIGNPAVADPETIRKFITSEKSTKCYIDKKCTAKMQPDRDTVYLWLDTGLVNDYGNPIMISLLRDSYGVYSGHYFGTMDTLAKNIKSFFPRNAKDISRNLNNLKNKYQNKIAEREHVHIGDEKQYLVKLCNGEAGQTEIETIISKLDIDFWDPVIEPAEEFEEIMEKELSDSVPDMSLREEEITIGILLDALDARQAYINELLDELKKLHEDKAKLRELEEHNKELEQTLVDIRKYNEEHSIKEENPTPAQNGHDLLGRRGKILVLGASALDTKVMNGIAKLYGFKKDDFDYELDYSKLVSFAGRCNKLESYSAVILGACPHKVQNLGDWSSFIDKCKNMDSMPIAIDARSKVGELKVTKESFRNALLEICKKLA